MTHVCPACGFEVTTWTCAKCGNDWAATGRILALAHATITATLIERRLRIRLPRWVRVVIDVGHVVVFDQRRDLGLLPSVGGEVERLAQRLDYHNLRLTTEETR